MNLESCGIYLIKNKITGDSYIGSSVNVKKRFKEHLGLLRRRKHVNRFLQNAFNKYGEQYFDFILVCNCSENLQFYLEQVYIDSCNPTYNIVKNVEGSPMKGRKHSNKSKELMKGRDCWNKGIPRTEKERILMSIRRKEVAKNTSIDKKILYKNRTSSFLKENKPFKNKNHSDFFKEDIRNFKIKGRKKILCHQNGKIYLAQNDIHKDLGIKQGHISENLNGKRPNVKGYTFEYLQEINEVESTLVSKYDNNYVENKIKMKIKRQFKLEYCENI